MKKTDKTCDWKMTLQFSFQMVTVNVKPNHNFDKQSVFECQNKIEQLKYFWFSNGAQDSDRNCTAKLLSIKSLRGCLGTLHCTVAQNQNFE